MADSDWDTVTILRKKPEKASQMKTQQVILYLSEDNE